MFALRMTNHDDQDILRDALSEAWHGLMNFLPAFNCKKGILPHLQLCHAIPDCSRETTNGREKAVEREI